MENMKKFLQLSHRFCWVARFRPKPAQFGSKPVHRISAKHFFNCSSSSNVGLVSLPRDFSNCSSTESFSTNKVEDSNRNGKDSSDVVIYRGTLTAQVKGIKIFTCATSVTGLLMQPIILQNILTGESVPLSVTFGFVVGFFTFVTPVLIHMLAKKYVVEIKHNPVTDTYTGTTLSFFVCRVNFDFKIEDVKVPDGLPIFTTLLVKGKPLFLVSDSFSVISHYIRMMGYDKPIDLKLKKPDDKLEDNQVVEKVFLKSG